MGLPSLPIVNEKDVESGFGYIELFQDIERDPLYSIGAEKLIAILPLKSLRLLTIVFREN